MVLAPVQLNYIGVLTYCTVVDACPATQPLSPTTTMFT